jgi:hypothetical protein
MRMLNLEMLQGSINDKIKYCKDSIHQAHNPIYNKSLEVEGRMGSAAASLIFTKEKSGI